MSGCVGGPVWLHHEVVRRWWRHGFDVVLGLAVFGAVYAAGVAVWLLLPGARPVPTPVALIAFAQCFPALGAASLLHKRYWRSGTPSALRLPGAVVRGTLFGLLTLAMGVIVLIAVAPDMSSPPGAPEIVQGHYVLNNHGSLTPVSRQVYLQALEGGQLASAVISMFLCIVAACITAMTSSRVAARVDRAAADQRSAQN